MRAQLADKKLASIKRADAARRLIAAADEPATVELVLKQISPTNPPEVQLGMLEAIGDSHAANVGTSLVGLWGQMTPTSQKAALNLMLRRSAWTGALLDGVQAGKINAKDVLPQQWQVLTSNPDNNLASRARACKSTLATPPAPIGPTS